MEPQKPGRRPDGKRKDPQKGIVCPSCQKGLVWQPERAGQIGVCPYCSGYFVFPMAAAFQERATPTVGTRHQPSHQSKEQLTRPATKSEECAKCGKVLTAADNFTAYHCRQCDRTFCGRCAGYAGGAVAILRCPYCSSGTSSSLKRHGTQQKDDSPWGCLGGCLILVIVVLLLTLLAILLRV
jgi:uncharacterized CHY-type Zn-finger protein